MCCFSGQVQRVSDTKIFARALASGWQVLVYEMKLAARDALAMVLPLPVPPGSAEDAVRFIDLQACADFFTRMDGGFPVSGGFSFGVAPQGLMPAAAPLAVQNVGAFEASFVPRVRDFERLDARFRLPAQAWDALPAYADWGFAVFKLKTAGAALQPVHPMAFEFPRRDPGALFFPTVHVHDGAVHPEAAFDHTLYCQPGVGLPWPWGSTVQPASTFMPSITFELGVVHRGQPCLRRGLHGTLPNADIVVPVV